MAETEVEQQNILEKFESDYIKNKPKGPQWVRKALARRHEKGSDDAVRVVKAGRFKAGSLAESHNAIRYKRVADINHENRSKVGIFQHRYTKNGRLALTVGPDRTVQFYAIDGASGRKAGSISLDIAAYNAHFMLNETKVLCVGQSQHYAIADIETLTSETFSRGNFTCNSMVLSDVKADSPVAAVGSLLSGIVTLFDTRTYRSVGKIRTNDPISCLQFDKPASNDPCQLWICAGGEVSLWDMRCTQSSTSGYDTPVNRHADHGGVNIRAFTASKGLYAVGSDVGVVSVYDAKPMRGAGETDAGQSPAWKPVHTILNLQTRITSLCCSPDEGKIIYASDAVQNAVRIFDTQTGKTYKNFPNAVAHSLGRTLSTQFSPDGSLITLGSSQGRVYTYEIVPE